MDDTTAEGVRLPLQLPGATRSGEPCRGEENDLAGSSENGLAWQSSVEGDTSSQCLVWGDATTRPPPFRARASLYLSRSHQDATGKAHRAFNGQQLKRSPLRQLRMTMPPRSSTWLDQPTQ